MSIKQIKQKERDQSKIRLFQAENTLNIHTGYNNNKNSDRYNTNMRMPSERMQRTNNPLIKEYSTSKVLLKDDKCQSN